MVGGFILLLLAPPAHHVRSADIVPDSPNHFTGSRPRAGRWAGDTNAGPAGAFVPPETKRRRRSGSVSTSYRHASVLGAASGALSHGIGHGWTAYETRISAGRLRSALTQPCSYCTLSCVRYRSALQCHPAVSSCSDCSCYRLPKSWSIGLLFLGDFVMNAQLFCMVMEAPRGEECSGFLDPKSEIRIYHPRSARWRCGKCPSHPLQRKCMAGMATALISHLPSPESLSLSSIPQ